MALAVAGMGRSGSTRDRKAVWGPMGVAHTQATSTTRSVAGSRPVVSVSTMSQRAASQDAGIGESSFRPGRVIAPAWPA